MNKLNRDDVLLLMALPAESKNIFEKSGIKVYYTGIGKINAAFTATEILCKHNYKHVLNLGTAGSHKFNINEIIECNEFVQRDMDLSPLGFPLGQTPKDSLSGKIIVNPISDFPQGICGTGDVFEMGLPKLTCDLVDMEAYAIAKVCSKMGVKFNSIKFITDNSNKNAHVEWKSNLKNAGEALLSAFLNVTK